jgi:trehalose-phosphatase
LVIFFHPGVAASAAVITELSMSRCLFDSLPEIEARLRHAPHLLLGLDFEGTLIPIPDVPTLARLPAATARVLQALAGQDRISLAIISGRERSDLQERIGIPNTIYAGNHGLDVSGPGCLFVDETAVAHGAALQVLAANLAAKLAPIPGALVEEKGLTLSIHDRLVAGDGHEEVRRIVHGVLSSSSHPFQLTTGNRVYDIRPRTSWHRGAALTWIRDQLRKPEPLTVYLGDDATDEDAFAAFPDGITVRVGGTGETAAHFQTAGPDEVQRFLEWIDGPLRG